MTNFLHRSYSFDRNFEAKQVRRMKAEDRYLTRLEKLTAKAERMIGELCRDGKPVYYVFPVGGKYRESTFATDLVDFLIRNKHVR